MSTFETNLDYSQLRDVNSPRAKFATIIPSTNTTVEFDFHDIRPAGITFPVGRMYIPEPQTGDDSEFSNMIDQVNASLEEAIKVVMTTNPDYLILAMSAPTFWGGVEGNQKMETRMREISGLNGVTSGSTAVRDALTALGAKNIAFLTPYQPVGDGQVERFFTEAGFNVKRSIGLKVPSIDKISSTPRSTLMDALRALDGDDIDVLVQAGTNLSMVRLADEAERWLGKPVVTINAAALWHALRNYGIKDQFEGFGTLLRDY
ncbi:maleate cis-trans isomerase family protein [Mycolicibacterium sp.]|uniref:maleate cis-trans isomerase family protein n=1 Tax=Mycolicibacterium sp. TaxID=2320850 RepID=UPI003D11D2D2